MFKVLSITFLLCAATFGLFWLFGIAINQTANIALIGGELAAVWILQAAAWILRPHVAAVQALFEFIGRVYGTPEYVPRDRKRASEWPKE